MAEIVLTEYVPREYAIVRGDARSLALAAAVANVLGIELPVTPNTVVEGRTHDALWLGPDEWLLVSKVERDPGVRQDGASFGHPGGRHNDAALERAMRPLLAGEFATVVDVSSGYVTLLLDGPRSREILQKGCPLDLHPRVLGAGMCAQSHFFKAAVVLRPMRDGRFELIVRRSFTAYAERMLRDALTS